MSGNSRIPREGESMILTGLHLALTPVGGNLEPKIMEVKLYQYPRGFNKGGLLQGDICPTISKSSWENNCLLIESSMNELIEKFNPEFVIGSTQRNAFVGSSDNYSPCITSACGMGGGQTPMVGNQFRIRKLTPRECFRLMGVSEENIDTIQAAGISNSQQYKLAGNSIVVDVLYHIFKKMFVDKENDNTLLTLF